MFARRPARLELALLAASIWGVGACTILGGQSKVKSGELYESGESRYDAYFKDVHDLQVSSVGWGDDRKAACRPLIDTLRLSPDAADVSLVQETHERVKAVSRDVGAVKLDVGDEVALTAANPARVDEQTRELFKSIELCAHAEATLKKTLQQIPTKVDALVKTGRELEPHIKDDFAKRGGRIPGEVQQEMSDSYEVLGDVSRQARLGARQSEDFVADLVRAVGTETPSGEEPKDAKGSKAKPAKPASAPPPAAPKPPSPPPASPPPAAPAEAKPKPPPPASPPPADQPKPKPKPKPDTGEVFNP